jgi:hypothetical protein
MRIAACAGAWAKTHVLAPILTPILAPILALGLIGTLLLPAAAQSDDCIATADEFIHADFPLPHVSEALDRKALTIVVLGSAYSTIGGANGPKAYPATLETVLRNRFPDVDIRVTTYAKPRDTAADMDKAVAPVLAKEKPALVVWQTGTVEAMRRVDPDEFRTALESGIALIQKAQSDVLLMNMQYSPRTETIFTVDTYAEVMRFVALQQELLLFDRFSIMKHWSELGLFDFYATTNKLDVAERVHQCIGRLMGDLIEQAAKSTKSQATPSQPTPLQQTPSQQTPFPGQDSH